MIPIAIAILAVIIIVLMTAMSKDAVQVGKIEEPSVVVDQTVAGSSVLITQSDVLPTNWKGRILRIVVTNQDNAVRTLSLYSGEDTDRNQTLVKQITLANYATRVLEVEHPEKDQISKWEVRTATEDVAIYGILDGVTTGVLVEQFDWVMDER